MKYGVILSGFTMIEVLIALMAISMFVPVVNDGLQLMQLSQLEAVEEMEDMMGIEQLRLYLACGTIQDVEDSILHFYMDKEMKLSLVNANITFQPGTMVFLKDVDDVTFYDDGYHVVMKYRKYKRDYEVWIGYK